MIKWPHRVVSQGALDVPDFTLAASTDALDESLTHVEAQCTGALKASQSARAEFPWRMQCGRPMQVLSSAKVQGNAKGWREQAYTCTSTTNSRALLLPIGRLVWVAVTWDRYPAQDVMQGAVWDPRASWNWESAKTA